jgi:hypothetical protein
MPEQTHDGLLPIIIAKREDEYDSTVAEALARLSGGSDWPVIKGWLDASASAKAREQNSVLDERAFRQGQGQGLMLETIISVVDKAALDLRELRDSISGRRTQREG